MALSPDGKTIAVMGIVSVSTYDFNSLKEIWTSLRFNIGTLLFGVDWSPDGKYLVVSTAQKADNALLVLDARTGEELHRFTGHYDVVGKVSWSPRGDLIASCSPDGTVIIWRMGQ